MTSMLVWLCKILIYGIFIIYRAKYNKDLHLVTPKRPPVQIPQPSVAELLLPDQINQFFGVIRDIRNDPKSVAFTTLAKLADYAGILEITINISEMHLFVLAIVFLKTLESKDGET